MLSAPCTLPCRVSDRKKKAAGMKKAGSKASLKGSASQASLADGGLVDSTAALVEEFHLNDRSTTGILTSHPQSRDIQFESFSLLYHGHELLQDTNLELNYGRCVGCCGGQQGAVPVGCCFRTMQISEAIGRGG